MPKIKMAESIIQRKNFTNISSNLQLKDGISIATNNCEMYSDGTLLVIKVNFRASDTVPEGVIITGVPTNVTMTFALNSSSSAYRGLITGRTIYLEQNIPAGWYNGEAVVPILF